MEAAPSNEVIMVREFLVGIPSAAACQAQPLCERHAHPPICFNSSVPCPGCTAIMHVRAGGSVKNARRCLQHFQLGGGERC